MLLLLFSEVNFLLLPLVSFFRSNAAHINSSPTEDGVFDEQNLHSLSLKHTVTP